ncbi:MAG: COP23 domain-containing protein [Xenococcus sp. (in: cyanobacteria)]
MKLNFLIFPLILITITGCREIRSPGLSRYEFICDEEINPPTTFVITPDKQKRTFIQWKSDFFNQPIAKEPYPPERRCREVTKRMNHYIESGSPRYVTHGIINKEPVICVTDEKGHDCTGLLYTLKRDVQDPDKVLREFLELNRNNFKGNPLVESPNCRTYIDIKAMIKGNLDKAEVFCTKQ